MPIARMGRNSAPVKRHNSRARFYLLAGGLALTLAVLWSGRNVAKLADNYRQIRRLKSTIARRVVAKEHMRQEIVLLEKNDPSALRRVWRQEFHALYPGEVEYRFSRELNIR